jgi:type III pantothenate kinase
MTLLIDIGNSRLKWGWSREGQIVSGPALVNDKINLTTLLDLWQQIPRPDQLVVSCVSASHLLEQVQKTACELWPAINIISATSQANAFGVVNSYQQPEKLGVDRWLSIIAAYRQYREAICIVDCGTALTIDLLAADGRHQGGFIVPGLTLMKKSLAQGTQALQHVTKSYIFEPANNTDAAIYNGTLAACCGLIEHVLSKQSQNVRLILTGGDAVAIANQLAVASIVDQDLVLRGLLCIAEEIE